VRLLRVPRSPPGKSVYSADCGGDLTLAPRRARVEAGLGTSTLSTQSRSEKNPCRDKQPNNIFRRCQRIALRAPPRPTRLGARSSIPVRVWQDAAARLWSARASPVVHPARGGWGLIPLTPKGELPREAPAVAIGLCSRGAPSLAPKQARPRALPRFGGATETSHPLRVCGGLMWVVSRPRGRLLAG